MQKSTRSNFATYVVQYILQRLSSIASHRIVTSTPTFASQCGVVPDKVPLITVSFPLLPQMIHCSQIRTLHVEYMQLAKFLELCNTMLFIKALVSAQGSRRFSPHLIVKSSAKEARPTGFCFKIWL